MCLYTYQQGTLIAKRDITCYKVLYYNSDNEYITPVMEVKIPFIPCTMEPKGGNGPVGILRDVSTSHANAYCIGKGYIHAYQDINKIQRPTYRKYVIVKCTIPKGTKYFKGVYNAAGVFPGYKEQLQESGNEICAKKMYLDKVVVDSLIPESDKCYQKKSLWQKVKSRLFNVCICKVMKRYLIIK